MPEVIIIVVAVIVSCFLNLIVSSGGKNFEFLDEKIDILEMSLRGQLKAHQDRIQELENRVRNLEVRVKDVEWRNSK